MNGLELILLVDGVGIPVTILGGMLIAEGLSKIGDWFREQWEATRSIRERNITKARQA